jgi:hypothetical protein
MDERRFDGIAKTMARKTDRRSMLRGLLGIGTAITAGVVGLEAASAARPAMRVAVLSPTCVRSCGPDSCGMPDGCGGICTICSGGLTCLPNGLCGALCAGNGDCDADSACLQEASGLEVCAGDATSDTCSSSIECPPGSFCAGESGICRQIGSGVLVA